ncbi:hypothetical protein CYMTET_43169 [Cymbomonas tetramitiformis]|uniref:Uncharacterized protein n=1 Tax=Cymbomonas tetramitiformis TaxID=36881 RepID=A0AAE0F091_9CHLO|nr:hypothetical protein CYMTET_43169 [Cymbomonas tetramitiformis]
MASAASLRDAANPFNAASTDGGIIVSGMEEEEDVVEEFVFLISMYLNKYITLLLFGGGIICAFAWLNKIFWRRWHQVSDLQYELLAEQVAFVEKPDNAIDLLLYAMRKKEEDNQQKEDLLKMMDY